MIIIIGAGLSGLLIAYRLKKEGIPFKVLEARHRIGGRIHTIKSGNDAPVEMGATWLGNQHRHLMRLLNELYLPCYEQYMKGTAFYQPNPQLPAEPIQLPPQAPSFRIAGGSSVLIQKLASVLSEDEIILNQKVEIIQCKDSKLMVQASTTFHADAVVMTIPPKLWSSQIVFDPVLPSDLIETSMLTHTWMEESIKVSLEYDRPFWREKQQSGALFTNVGPFTELYDHCNYDGSKYALCGFVHPSFGKISLEERKEKIALQLTKTFGPEASSYLEYQEVLWNKEEFTHQPSYNPLFPHQNNGHPVFSDTYFNGKLFFSGTETSAQFGGYMEGAVVSAERTIQQISGMCNEQL
jgi:monoamine oxidase